MSKLLSRWSNLQYRCQTTTFTAHRSMDVSHALCHRSNACRGANKMLNSATSMVAVVYAALVCESLACSTKPWNTRRRAGARRSTVAEIYFRCSNLSHTQAKAGCVPGKERPPTLSKVMPFGTVIFLAYMIVPGTVIVSLTQSSSLRFVVGLQRLRQRLEKPSVASSMCMKRSRCMTSNMSVRRQRCQRTTN